MDLREYELMLILLPEADDKVIGGVTDRVTQVLGASGGRIVDVDRWGKRRFACPINKATEGVYLVLDLDADPGALKELERVLSLADEVIRFKIVVRPPKTKAPSRVASETAGAATQSRPAAPSVEDVAAPGEDAAAAAVAAQEEAQVEAPDAEEASAVSNMGPD
ncbi:MAG TPA: 30S ribosomal protein S6 [Actinomycetota bacterium]